MRPTILHWILVADISFHAAGQNTDIKTIKKLNEEWLLSIEKKDTATLSKILADDFILIAPNGSSLNKQQNLMNLLSPDVELNSVHIDSANVRLITQNVGILTAWTRFSMKADGKAAFGKNCYQDIYMKRKNKWVAVSAHVGLLAK